MPVVSTIAGSLGEPSMTLTFLPRCPACEAPHPLARKPPMPADACPDCGGPQTIGRTKTVRAIITGRGPWPWLANRCFAAAQWIRGYLERTS